MVRPKACPKFNWFSMIVQFSIQTFQSLVETWIQTLLDDLQFLTDIFKLPSHTFYTKPSRPASKLTAFSLQLHKREIPDRKKNKFNPKTSVLHFLKAFFQAEDVYTALCLITKNRCSTRGCWLRAHSFLSPLELQFIAGKSIFPSLNQQNFLLQVMFYCCNLVTGVEWKFLEFLHKNLSIGGSFSRKRETVVQLADSLWICVREKNACDWIVKLKKKNITRY